MPDDQPLSPPYDPKKYRLGTLCKRGHVYGGARHADGSPGSLRELAGSNCVVCKAEYARRYWLRAAATPVKHEETATYDDRCSQ